MNRYDRELYAAAARRFLDDKIRPNLFLTFNFNPARNRTPQTMAELESGQLLKPSNAKKKITGLFNRLQRKTFGDSWMRQMMRPWPTALGFCENLESNLHYHVLARTCDRFAFVLAAAGDECWKELVPGGSMDLKGVFDQVGAIGYCTKRLEKFGSADAMFVYSDPRDDLVLTEDVIERLTRSIKEDLQWNDLD